MRRSIALVALAALLAGCGTTHLYTNDPNARIYVDGVMVGKGKGEITMRGIPGSASVLVAAEDGRRRQTSIKRSFTLATLVFGFITYGVCWLACWDFPGAIAVDLPEVPRASFTPSFGGAPAGADPWLLPPPGWRPPTAAPADAPPPAPPADAPPAAP